MFRRCWLKPPCLLANPYFKTQALGHLFIRLLLLKDQIFGRLAFAALRACINLWHCLNGCQSFVSQAFTRVPLCSYANTRARLVYFNSNINDYISSIFMAFYVKHGFNAWSEEWTCMWPLGINPSNYFPIVQY